MARLRALRVPLRIYTARVKLKISSRSFFPILWLTLPLFPLTLRSSNHAIRYFSILSVEGKITVDFVGRFKKKGRGEKSKKVFTHLRHHRSPYRNIPLLVRARKNRPVISPLTSYGLSGYFRSALFSKSSTCLVQAPSDRGSSPPLLLIGRQILVEYMVFLFSFFARYIRDRARDNEHSVSASFLNLQRGDILPGGGLSFVVIE